MALLRLSAASEATLKVLDVAAARTAIEFWMASSCKNSKIVISFEKELQVPPPPPLAFRGDWSNDCMHTGDRHSFGNPGTNTTCASFTCVKPNFNVKLSETGDVGGEPIINAKVTYTGDATKYIWNSKKRYAPSPLLCLLPRSAVICWKRK